MLHPAMVLAVVVLAVNDHWLKGRFGADPAAGIVTGKLSDLAGLAFFPALLVGIAEVAGWALRRDRGGRAPGRRGPAVAMAVTAVGFAAVQTIPAAAMGYEAALAVIRWLPASAVAALSGRPWPPWPQIGHVMDVSDLVCLPATWISGWVARRTAESPPRAVGPPAGARSGAGPGTTEPSRVQAGGRAWACGRALTVGRPSRNRVRVCGGPRREDGSGSAWYLTLRAEER